MKNIQTRQGDILFESGDSPFNKLFEKHEKDLVKKSDRSVALGESTGHSHTLKGGTVLTRPELPLIGKKVLIEEPTEIVHEDHGPIPFEGPSESTVTHQRVASPYGFRRVTD